MLLFRSEDHIDRWCRTWKIARGGTLTLEQGWRLAQAWYSPDRRDPAWRRKNVTEVEALFVDLGLTSEFWSLRPPTSPLDVEGVDLDISAEEIVRFIQEDR